MPKLVTCNKDESQFAKLSFVNDVLHPKLPVLSDISSVV